MSLSDDWGASASTIVKYHVFLDGVRAQADFPAEPAPGLIFKVASGPYARITSVRRDGDGNRIVGAKRISPRTFALPDENR
jgi:hypothetical protein